jgi:hypothetical protein
VPYLEGALSPGETERVESHLAGCEKCRSLFIRLRDGHLAARHLRDERGEEAQGSPAYDSIRDGIGIRLSIRRRWALAWENRLAVSATPRMIRILAGMVVVLAVLLVVSNRNVLFGTPARFAGGSRAFDLRDFHPIRIPEIQANTRPRIATEGYVSDVRIDEEEKILHFKLTEIPQKTEPFVVCEVMNPSAKKRPREGSRVRVYGVARYDAQPGREWHEVNPVFDIFVLKR